VKKVATLWVTVVDEGDAEMVELDVVVRAMSWVEEEPWWGICELSSFRVTARRNHGSPAVLLC